MASPSPRRKLWEAHDGLWRDPAQVITQWPGASAISSSLLRHRVIGPWWALLDDLDICLLVSREYEHLLVAATVWDGRPRQTFLPLPHPSGIAFDERRGRVHVASTRNPNQVIDLVPAIGVLTGTDSAPALARSRPLAPVGSRFYPGSLYLHDLALIGGKLYGSAAGRNAIVRLAEDGQAPTLWWPRSIERDGRPDLARNYLQLNSIAAGRNLTSSFFSASADRPSGRRPGHRNFPVDRRGVVFSGATGTPVVRGLTRPHSARLRDRALWVLNSGYGEVGYGEGGRFTPVARLRGWTRGLCFQDRYAFVATSRVIPRYRQYAPGLDVDHSLCGVHALDLGTGELVASLIWPNGNQVFAVQALPRSLTGGLPFTARARPAHVRELFYRFTTKGDE